MIIMARPVDFFRENLELFGDLNEKERYNLYGGLIALAKQIDDIERRVQNMEANIYNLINRSR